MRPSISDSLVTNGRACKASLPAQVERGVLPKLASMPGGLNALSALQGVDFEPALQSANKNDILNKVGVSFRMWCKDRHVERPPCNGSLHMIGRQDTGNAYPTLESGIKAAHTKPILFYLSELATQIADVCGCCLSTRYKLYGYTYDI